MPDNINTPFPSGTKFSTDQQADGSHVQWTKEYGGAYAVTKDGGRVAFNSITGYLTIPTGAGEHNLAAFVNPAGSGKDAILTLGEFGANANTRFRRYGGGATVSGLGTPRPAGNRGGGITASVAKLYIPGQYTPANANETATPANNANLRKVAFIAAFVQYITRLSGEAIVRPGQQIVWTIDNDAQASFLAMVYLEWHELPAEAD